MKVRNDLSIEYAHIYTNNKIDKEQEVSPQILNKVTKKLKDQNKSYSLVVMVDDYSFPDPSFDYKYFTSWLGNQGFKPDLVFRESQLIPVCDQVLSKLKNSKLKEDLIDYIKTKKYPCSFFIAAWYLLRLGYLEYPMFDKQFVASDILNILPSSFRPFEEKGLEIIGATEFEESLDRIKYEYIEGRLIA